MRKQNVQMLDEIRGNDIGVDIFHGTWIVVGKRKRKRKELVSRFSSLCSNKCVKACIYIYIYKLLLEIEREQLFR